MEETFNLFNGKDKQLLEIFMVAIEMIHTYSLVHDDFTAMDNDDYRRGKKTTHIVYGEAMAILTGDALLNYAFEMTTKSFQNINDESPDALRSYQNLAKAIEILASKSGVRGMIGGQVVDIEAEGILIDKNRLDFIYQLKTSALIEAAMKIGAVLAGADEKEVEEVEKIARAIGLSFQIRDDILDVVSSEEALGKPVLSDEKNEKTTYVTIMGLELASEEVDKISQEAIRIYNDLPYQNLYLKNLILMLIDRDK